MSALPDVRERKNDRGQSQKFPQRKLGQVSPVILHLKSSTYSILEIQLHSTEIQLHVTGTKPKSAGAQDSCKI